MPHENETFTLRTERLTLRPLEMNDLATSHQYAGDAENTKYMLYLPNRTVQETEGFLRRVAAEWTKEHLLFYEFAVVLDGKHIGAVSVCLDRSGQEGEIGWILHKSYQGNGYATEAAKAVLDFAINKLKVRKVAAYCDYRNEPSRRVMQKIGLSLEHDDGIRRYKDSDEDIQALMYSLKIG